MEQYVGLSNEGAAVRSYLETNNFRFKQHPTKPDTFLLMSGILEVVTLDADPICKLNGAEVKLSELKNKVDSEKADLIKMLSTVSE